MKLLQLLPALLTASALLLGGAAPPARAQTAAPTPNPGLPDVQIESHGLFAQVAVFAPRGEPQQLVLLLSGANGPDASDRRQARALAAQGVMVALVDTPAFAARLDAEGGTCGFPAGAFESLSRHLQAYHQFKGYRLPLLVGREAGATLAYGLLAQADPHTFGGAVSVNFCPRLPFRQPLCSARALPPSSPASVPSVFAAASAATRGALPGSRLAPATARLSAPWWVLQTADAPGCAADAGPAIHAFVSRVRDAQWRSAAAGVAPLTGEVERAVAELSAQNQLPPSVPKSLADLPIVEAPTTLPGQRFAVLVSGDGGWAGIDKALAAALVARGVPVAGFDSLRYFWSARTPAGLAADLDRVVRFYGARWNRRELILIGFSQGADVLPFAINRLDPDTRSRLKLAVLISPAPKASFEFKLSNWLGPSGEVPVLPEALKLDAATTLCIHGRDDKESICPALKASGMGTVLRNGGHHLDGDYDTLARTLLEHVGR